MEVARKNDAWLHRDEVYRHLNQTDEYAESVVDLTTRASPPAP